MTRLAEWSVSRWFNSRAEVGASSAATAGAAQGSCAVGGDCRPTVGA
ncbi:hypothetical protein [Sorangium sp. So ce406]